MPEQSAASFNPDQPKRDADTPRVEQRNVFTGGGDYAENGIIDKRHGVFVDGNLITEERAYNVAGQPNPYLGLRAFTAAERSIFAGRSRIVQTLVQRLSNNPSERLLFIAGASGCGKSSLARAGLLPELADRLREGGATVQTQIVEHPGWKPASTLGRILQSALPDTETSNTIILLLIDQFEEIFTQAEPDERKQALALLATHAAQPELPLTIIATMRSDFLPQLAAVPGLAAAERGKVVLPAMSIQELAEAIQRPLQVCYPDRRFEPALVERLAADTAVDAAYLPLLQVTLEDLWRGGNLRLSTYKGLTQAIQDRANAVYAYRDYDGLRQEQRTPEEQQTILGLFLALVWVALDGKQPDARWRRPRAELTQDEPQHERLIADLASARLLRTDRETLGEGENRREIETVDLVHEALLTGWPTLSTAIEANRDMLCQRVRFELALAEWRSKGRADDYRLVGVRLADAESLRQSRDGVFLREGALDFYEYSLRQRDEERQRKLAETEALLKEERLRRRAERRGRLLAQGMAVLLATIAVALAYTPLLNLWRRSLAAQPEPIAIPGMPGGVRFEPSEVTNARYRLCVDAGRCTRPVNTESTYYEDKEQHPATGIDVFQAASFCSWIGRRLPALPEWKYAALEHSGRGSYKEWDEMRKNAHLYDGDNTIQEPLEVIKSQSVTPEGIFDLLGNVQEWTVSPYRDSDDKWEGDPNITYDYLITAGGYFNTPSDSPDNIYQGYPPSDRQSFIGFRCVSN